MPTDGGGSYLVTNAAWIFLLNESTRLMYKKYLNEELSSHYQGSNPAWESEQKKLPGHYGEPLQNMP